MACSRPGCVMKQDDETIGVYFHPTCARQAGLEVIEKDQKCCGTYCSLLPDLSSSLPNILFVWIAVMCYRHGGNEYNLRAHLEDLVEIEKRRAGKNFAKADNPMKFSDACRILHASIRVMRVLGWAWRWAEWWVDYGSSWYANNHVISFTVITLLRTYHVSVTGSLYSNPGREKRI